MSLAKVFIVFGLIFIAIGVLFYFKLPVGRLPGDIVVDKGDFKFYFPITTSILISILLMAIWYVVMFFRK